MINLCEVKKCPDISQKEKLIINFLIENINNLHNIGIDEVIKTVNVGYSTFYNFMNKLGYKNYNVFITDILNTEKSKDQNTVNFNNLSIDYTNVISRSYHLINQDELKIVINNIKKAKIVYLLGIKENALAAENLAWELSKHNLATITLSPNDQDNLKFVINNLPKDGLLIIFSSLGKTKIINDVLSITKTANYNTVLFTTDNNACTKAAHTVVVLDLNNFAKQHYINANLPFIFLADYIVNNL